MKNPFEAVTIAGFMPEQTRIVSPGPQPGVVRAPDGKILQPPADWQFLPAGDAAWTRRVKAAGPSWTVQQKRGRRTFSLGVWAPQSRIATIGSQLEAERATPAHAKRRLSDARRRQRQQDQYVSSFYDQVRAFLAFAACHAEVEKQLAEAVTRHATPVGSGTVARTQRISIEQRAEAAVIAWMRHQTTAYDNLAIPREKGKRREVRRLLAEQSRRLLQAYRAGQAVAAANCPLQRALDK